MREKLLFLATISLCLFSNAQDSDLPGTWYLSGFQADISDDFPIGVNDAPQNPTLTINPDFSYQGIAACNTFSGTFVYTGIEDTYAIQNFTRTTITCETPSHTSFESSYFFYLNGVEEPQVRLYYEGSQMRLEGMSPGFGLKFLDTVFLGIDDAEANNIKIYPNPTADILNIWTSETIAIESINIYTLTGQIVMSTAKATQIDTSALKKGVYVIKILSDGQKTIKRFIKK